MSQKPYLYLDHNATAPIRPEVAKLMTAMLLETGNPSSIHYAGRSARNHIENARQRIGRIFDVDAKQIIFTSGATESNNTILNGFRDKRILVSAIEHPSLLDAGVAYETIPVTRDGVVDLNALQALLNNGIPTALISVMLVNNETGVIQPVAEIAAIAKQHGTLVHCDVTQAVGRIPFTRASLGVDFMTLSSHKIGGPQGVGATIFAAKAPLPKLLLGGGQENRQRAGTENVAGIAGFGLAVEIAQQSIPAFQALETLRNKLEHAIQQSVPNTIIHGKNAQRVANTSCFSVVGIQSETMLMNMDLEHIAISSGSACSSGSIKPSHVLLAMGVNSETAKCAVRISMGWDTTTSDIDHFLEIWEKTLPRLIKNKA